MKVNGVVKAASMMLLTLGVQAASAAVWVDTQKWSNEWEEKYSAWVEAEFSSRYFMDGPYGKIATDCADAVYAARIIFSYENKLPFVIKNPYGQGYYTNKMSNFDAKKEGKERVRSFLFNIFEQTSTKSLPNDTYPVAINRANVRAGTVWLRPSREEEFSLARIFGGKDQRPGHTDLVKSVSREGVVTLIGSTVPSAVRELKEVTDFYILPEIKVQTGLRNWKWPEHYNMKESQLPGYGLDQYEMGAQVNNYGEGGPQQGSKTVQGWSQALKEKLALSTESKGAYLTRLAKNFCVLVKERVSIVATGENLRSRLGGSCMSYSQWDNYSTPGRDQMVVKSLKKLIAETNLFPFLSRSSVEKTRRYLETCGTLEIMPGRTVDYTELAIRYSEDMISSDPNHPIEARWGEMQKPRSTCTYKEN